jgi:hypothetical protein
MIAKPIRKKLKRQKVKPPKKAKVNAKLKAINRKKEKQKRKNFLPTLVVTIILWVVVAGMVYFTDPLDLGIIPVFLVLMFTTTLFTLSLVFADTRRGVITASALTLFLVLRLYEIGNIINLLLITGLALAIDYYFHRSKA